MTTVTAKTFEPYDRIRIVNLPERSDRRRDMDHELAKVGLLGDPRVAYFHAIRPDDAGAFTSIGAHGVYRSQCTILREAAAAGQSVLILEDDCAFVSDAGKRQIDTGWDIFYGGYTAKTSTDLHASDIEGAHMMGFSIEGARTVSDYLENLDCDGIHPPIDAAYVWFRRAHPDVATAFAVPPLAGQRASRSDIADLRWFDRVPVLRNMANGLRSLRAHQ